MIADLELYPAMKDSGVEWLGEVPEHWDLVPNRALLKLKKQVVGDRADKYTLLSLTKRGIIVRDMVNPEGKFPTSFDTYQVVEPGDLIFCLFDIDETPRAVGLSSLSGMITGAYTRFVCADEQARQFIYLLYLYVDNGKLLKPLYSGLRKVVTKSTFLSAKLVLPPLREQAGIVRYLDYVDRRIRRYIRAKQKLIELLEEQKQAIIHRAITRGLEPDVPFKPSGVEWLGDVPEHWEVTRFKRIAGVAGRLVDPRSEEQRSKTLIAPNHIERDGTSRLLKRETADEQGADSGKYEVRVGEIVYCKIRPYLRKAVIAPCNCLCSADMYPIALKENVSVTYEFLLLEMLSLPFTQYTVDCSLRAAMPKINREALAEAPVWLPPLSEQSAITSYLAEVTADIDTAIDRARREIELLGEYRTRLIADVVTGKLDVREAAARLPEEADAYEEPAGAETGCLGDAAEIGLETAP